MDAHLKGPACVLCLKISRLSCKPVLLAAQNASPHQMLGYLPTYRRFRLIPVEGQACGVLDQIENRSEAGPAHEILVVGIPAGYLIRRIVLPDSSRLLIDLRDHIQMVDGNVLGQLMEPVLLQSAGDKGVGWSPHRASPVSASWIVSLFVRSHNRNPVYAVKGLLVLQPFDETFSLFLICYAGHQREEARDRLDSGLALAKCHIVIKSVLFVPHIVIDFLDQNRAVLHEAFTPFIVIRHLVSPFYQDIHDVNQIACKHGHLTAGIHCEPQMLVSR